MNEKETIKSSEEGFSSFQSNYPMWKTMSNVVSMPPLTDDEQLWMDRIGKNALWLRYAPEYIKSNGVLQMWLMCKAQNSMVNAMSGIMAIHQPGEKLPQSFYYGKSTRNERGEEKHESRRCEGCGR